MKRATKRGPRRKKSYSVKCDWDADARVWYVSETDIPGLATEAATVAAMTRKLRLLIPEMLALNEGAAAVEVPVELLWHKQEVISIKRV
jgi:Domain of unknown function (DUF1902)